MNQGILYAASVLSTLDMELQEMSTALGLGGVISPVLQVGRLEL